MRGNRCVINDQVSSPAVRGAQEDDHRGKTLRLGSVQELRQANIDTQDFT